MVASYTHLDFKVASIKCIHGSNSIKHIQRLWPSKNYLKFTIINNITRYYRCFIRKTV